jgi:hypothetical protein
MPNLPYIAAAPAAAPPGSVLLSEYATVGGETGHTGFIASLAGASHGRAGGAQSCGAAGVSSPPGHRNGAWGCVVPEARR